MPGAVVLMRGARSRPPVLFRVCTGEWGCVRRRPRPVRAETPPCSLRWRTAERLELEKRKGGGKEKEASEPADSPGSAESESCCSGGQPSLWSYRRGRKNEEEASQLCRSPGSAKSESCKGDGLPRGCSLASSPSGWKGENKAKGSGIEGEDSSCCSPAPAWHPSPRRWSSLNFLPHESFLQAAALPERLQRGSLLRLTVLLATKYNGGGGFPQSPGIRLWEQPPAPAGGIPPRAAEVHYKSTGEEDHTLSKIEKRKESLNEGPLGWA
ncbi:uncharacterized protein LOC122154894 [Tyto alba]|uniref:uncharacterized protein LOC122154894 n=1 Tax=Tyto alba TaxID=56313 RepID=UPI001C672BD6|nr:uncharacterized protein LOC122154894 [Tyto alba]